METRGEIPPCLSGSSACVVGRNSMYVFAGHHDDGPSTTVSCFLFSFQELRSIDPVNYKNNFVLKDLFC